MAISSITDLRDRMPSIMEQAAIWHARLVDGDLSADDRAAFDRWLSQDESHLAAYNKVEDGWHLLRSMAEEPALEALRAQARTPRRPWRLSAMQDKAVAAMLAVVMVCASVYLLAPTFTAPTSGPTQVTAATRTYTTGVGEIATFRLPDGSLATLDTDSELNVRYAATGRDLELVRGQAFFEVEKDANRPFSVQVQGLDVVALGTSFNVRIGASEKSVALIEGFLRVDAGDGRPRRMHALQKLTASDDRIAVTSFDDASVYTGWSEGFVTFENRTVAEVVDEMNRYVTTPILVEDDSLASRRVSGTFKVGNSDAFVEALAQYYPMMTQRQGDRAIQIRSR